MSKLEKIIEFILGTGIVWMPILACIIIEKLFEVITINMVMNAVYFIIIASLVAFIVFDIKDTKEKRGLRANGKIR